MIPITQSGCPCKAIDLETEEPILLYCESYKSFQQNTICLILKSRPGINICEYVKNLLIDKNAKITGGNNQSFNCAYKKGVFINPSLFEFEKFYVTLSNVLLVKLLYLMPQSRLFVCFAVCVFWL